MERNFGRRQLPSGSVKGQFPHQLSDIHWRTFLHASSNSLLNKLLLLPFEPIRIESLTANSSFWETKVSISLWSSFLTLIQNHLPTHTNSSLIKLFTTITTSRDIKASKTARIKVCLHPPSDNTSSQAPSHLIPEASPFTAHFTSSRPQSISPVLPEHIQPSPSSKYTSPIPSSK